MADDSRPEDGLEPEFHRLLDVYGRFELFPNGHPYFLSPSALRSLNALRREAIRSGDETMVPYQKGSRGEKLRNTERLRYRSTAPVTNVLQELMGASRSGVIVENEAQNWDRASTTVRGIVDGVFGAGSGGTIVFRIRSLLGAGEYLDDVVPDSTLEVVSFVDSGVAEEERALDVDLGGENASRRKGRRKRAVSRGTFRLEDMGSADAKVARLFVIDVLWGYKSLVNYLRGTLSGDGTNGAVERDGFVICTTAG